ncbi:beta-glucosidase 1A [Coccomyxa sp. Obi]|nr:beta-glucosidase 1A [Coccomyxa sp. Obi]
MVLAILYFVATVVVSTVALGRDVPFPNRPTLAQSLTFKDLPQAALDTWATAPTPEIETLNFQAPAPAAVSLKTSTTLPPPTATHTPTPAATTSPPPPPAILPSPPPPSPPPSPPALELPPLPERPPFVLGFASAAYQFEGAYLEDGKGWSIWDDYTNNHTVYTERHIQDCGTDGHFARCNETIHNNETGNESCDFYHRFKEDFALAKQLHAKSYRFSIAWARIFPNGDGAINLAGIQHYVEVVDELLKLGIEPAVTLYHWDLPMALQERFGGFNSEAIVPVFTNYAVAMFQALGDKVNYWTTFNEPMSFCYMGYGGGYGGLNVNAPGIHDAGAAQRRLDFVLGLFADPVYLGQFPDSVKARVPYLPEITPELATALNGSCDYFALNHYTTVYAQYDLNGREPLGPCDYAITHEKDGVLLGVPADAGWIYSVPWGFRELLKYINERYKPTEISVTESGFQVKGESNATNDDIFIAYDEPRIQYFKEYILEATKAVIYDKVPLTSYHAWALTDNFEWVDGYSKHFGVFHVDFATQKRTPRASARFLANRFKD